MCKENCREVSFEEIQKNEEINALIERGNAVLFALGYTEHSRKHAAKVAQRAGEIVRKTGHSEREAKLARIAGYMHDIGNSVNRHNHAHSGAILAWQILRELKMPLPDILTVMTAIGNHDEETGTAVDVVSAALILADKTDVRRSRVRNPDVTTFDIHDRVNYAVTSSKTCIDEERENISLVLTVDTGMCAVMDYFEIFLDRMLLCKRACEVLGYKFKLVANGSKLC